MCVRHHLNTCNRGRRHKTVRSVLNCLHSSQSAKKYQISIEKTTECKNALRKHAGDRENMYVSQEVKGNRNRTTSQI